MKVVSLKTEFLNNPLGIDVTHPLISWKIEGSDIKHQKSFEIVYKINNLRSKFILL